MEMQQYLKYAQDWLQSGHPVVLAVVSKTWGSAPRPVGSLMIIHALGHFEGSVSGGCIESSVITEAAALMGASQSKTLDFSVANEDAWQVGLSCGGRIQVQLFPFSPKAAHVFSQALQALEKRIPGSLRLDHEGGSINFTALDKDARSSSSLKANESDLSLASGISLDLRPCLSLVIVGAVHISQSLAPMAVACGYDVTLVDPRELFTAQREFKGAAIVKDWPDEYLQSTPLDAYSALVTLTHDPKIDDAALRPALASDAFYIGSLGSTKTHAARRMRLAESGYSANQIDRIKGPVGLSIGAKSSAEIAVSIMAELTKIYRATSAL